MSRFAVVGVALSIGVLAFAPRGSRPVLASPRSRSVLRAHGFDPGPVDGVRVRSRQRARRRSSGQRRARRRGGWPRDAARARWARPSASRPARARSSAPLVGRGGARVSAAPYGLGCSAVDGRFHVVTSAALRRSSNRHGARPRRDRRPTDISRAGGACADLRRVVRRARAPSRSPARYHVSPLAARQGNGSS